MQTMQPTQPPQTTTQSCMTVHWQYQPFQAQYCHPDGTRYASYGLQVWLCCNGQRQLGTSIGDISTDQDFVETLALQFTLQQLSPIHFYEAVIDALP